VDASAEAMATASADNRAPTISITMLKNLTCFRIQPAWDAPSLDHVSEALARHAFRPCGPTDRRSAGWVAPRGQAHGAPVEAIAGQWLMTLCIETRAVPASAVRESLDARLDALEAQTGRRPRGKVKRDLKEEVEHALLPRAFTRKASITVWLNPGARMLILGTTSARVADTVVAELQTIFDDRLPLAPIQTATSPAVAMAGWLREREAPAGFTIDRECELRQGDDNRATVKYLRHPLLHDEIVHHLDDGKLPVHLAMTWEDRVSFVLTDELGIKRVKFLDLQAPADTTESPARAGDAADDFDADAALATGELSQLMADLLDALGGEPAAQEMSAPA
jgi:recombination associated protein RdgC